MMGCLFSKFIDKPTIDALDYTPKGSEFEYLRPREQIIVQIDEKFKVPVVILDLDECTPKYVCLWPYTCLQRKYFLNLDRTALPTPSPSEDSDSGYDTVFQFY